jgi:hypothetical protein
MHKYKAASVTSYNTFIWIRLLQQLEVWFYSSYILLLCNRWIKTQHYIFLQNWWKMLYRFAK